ncbi:MAG: HAMP domain-containing histidine kinase [Bacteroidetes bacterium]|nr:MAG: HAMP domain-containing histidine kinase [Bacteroidota bacterium]
MPLYQLLNKIPLLRQSYAAKFLFIAFLGIHIPLLGMLAYYLNSGSKNFPLNDFLVILILTLVATGITLLVLFALLAPITKSVHLIKTYPLRNTTIQHELDALDLDEAGILLENIEQMLHDVKERESWREELLSIMSHDLRSPVSTIVTLADLIELSTQETETKDLIKHIQNFSHQQLDLLESTLTLIRYDSSEIEYHAINCFDLLEFVVKLQERSLKQKDLKITVEGSAGHVALANRTMLERIIHNLLSNAIKYSHDNGEIKLKSVRNGDMIELHVQDFGTGIPPLLQRRLFERFTSSGRKGTKGESSTGLGLFLSKRFSERMHGTLRVESEGENRGSTFILSIPSVA